jgi:hypothetical protein
MKSVFDVMLIIFVTLTMFICMMFFAEEVTVQQQTVHLRNRVIEILEINGGYTEEAKEEVDNIIDNLNREVEFNISKEGKLEYGEKITFDVVVLFKRKLPFYKDPMTVRYVVNGEYFNTNAEN